MIAIPDGYQPISGHASLTSIPLTGVSVDEIYLYVAIGGREVIESLGYSHHRLRGRCCRSVTASSWIFDSRDPYQWNLMLFGRMYPRLICFTETHPATNCIAFA
jgi:hypothetical protein